MIPPTSNRLSPTRIEYADQARQKARNRAAFTMVELLVVLGILTILTGLLLPAVQHSREAARRLKCQSNIRQLALAVLQHESAHRHFPAGGLGFRWVGDSSLGSGRFQPGGWIFSSLPYLEQDSLYLQCNRLSNMKSATALGAHIDLIRCPSRPLNDLLYLGEADLHNALTPRTGFKTHYAINGGDHEFVSTPGPIGDKRAIAQWESPHRRATGICFAGSWLRIADILDGLSNTYLIGEKYVSLDVAITHEDRDFGHDQAALIGDDHDIRRWCQELPRRDQSGRNTEVFGSRHETVWMSAQVDGSVRAITFAMDSSIHRRLGNRKDGNPTSETSF